MPGGVNSPVQFLKNVNSSQYLLKVQKGLIFMMLMITNMLILLDHGNFMILGHSNPRIIKAVEEQLQLGTSYGAPTEGESKMEPISYFSNAIRRNDEDGQLWY